MITFTVTCVEKHPERIKFSYPDDANLKAGSFFLLVKDTADDQFVEGQTYPATIGS